MNTLENSYIRRCGRLWKIEYLEFYDNPRIVVRYLPHSQNTLKYSRIVNDVCLMFTETLESP